MEKADKGRVERAQSVGVPNIARRFAAVEPGKAPAKPAEAKAVLAQAEAKGKPLAASKPGKNKGGRPTTVGKPWIAAGLSKSVYYRQLKAKP